VPDERANTNSAQAEASQIQNAAISRRASND